MPTYNPSVQSPDARMTNTNATTVQFDWISEDLDFLSLHVDPRFERAVARLVAIAHDQGAG